ncbi:MAG: protein kinase domain-containing protein [Myxococcota bacterium]
MAQNADDNPALAETSAPTGAPQTLPVDAQRLDELRRSDADALVGARLEHFRIDAPIGEGGMGSVYRAHDVSLERDVALKVLPREFAAERPALIERFKREARTQARLSHPNVVPIYFIGEEEGLHFFAMELVEGESLADRLERGDDLDPDEAIDLLIQVARALQQAHEKELIHRDLKPGNLLIRPDGKVKVADFGLAKPIDEGNSELTQEGGFLGTPLYIAPEQARGRPLDHRADMYALGATFWHLIAGRPVFEAPTPMAVAVKHVSEAPPDIESLREDVPGPLADVLRRLLAKSPDDRFDDYGELIERLEDIRQPDHPPAGLFPRFAAMAVDGLLVLPFGFVADWLPPVAFAVYVIAAWSIFGQTLGKRLLNIRVACTDGSRPTLWRSIRRFTVMSWGVLAFLAIAGAMSLMGMESIAIENSDIVSPGNAALQLTILAVMIASLVLWIAGFLVVPFRGDKRSAYDLIADTKVVYSHR